jgi:ABC-2 type transport system permease protein
VTAGTAVGRGAGAWWHAFLVMVRWELTSLRLQVPVTIAVQILAGAGFAVGIGLFRELPPELALYLACGTAVITLVLVGLILAPQLIAQQKAADTYDFLWSLPVPRSAAVAAWTTVTAVMGLPGMVAAVAVSAWRYDLAFEIDGTIVPAVLLVITVGTMMGYALAHAVGNPMVTQAVTQVLIFFIIGFSPINFPASRLPDWLQTLHRALPFEAMGIVIRRGLAPSLAADVGRAYLVLTLWLVGTTAVTAAVLTRRG